MNWLEKILPSIIPSSGAKKNFPKGIWSKCQSCENVLYYEELEVNLNVCPKCGYHERISAKNRLKFFLDKEKQIEIAENIESLDFLKFKDSKKYKDRITAAQKMTNEKEALIVKKGLLKKMPVVVAAFEFNYMGGSMGSVVGEKFVRGIHAAIENNCPFICFATSGGARMQEGLTSLMQMAKTSLSLRFLADKKLAFISVLTDPTMGGVSASFASLGDINIAEPGALIGFAGPRVVEQTVREKLPKGFQRSEFLLEKGAIDLIVNRKDMRDKIHSILSMLEKRTIIN